MPHISVKLREGYTPARKARLSDALASAIVETLDIPAIEKALATHRRV